MREQLTWFVILSAQKTGRKDNDIRHNNLKRRLTDEKYQFIEAKGCYKGDKEDCFIVTLDNPNGYFYFKIPHLKDIANDYDQESILVRDNEGYCTLHYVKTGDISNAGQWHEVSEYEHPDCYTEVNGQRYTG
jgi:hypothetical protein